MLPKYQYINIEFLNTENNNKCNLKFKPRANTITQRWIEILEMATQLYPIDQPDRFYDFDNNYTETKRALDQIQKDISIINTHSHIINRTLASVHDQNTLNYLHNIFEMYHGLLDTQKSSEYWAGAPSEVRNALADLNIDVHRCEHVQRRTTPQPRVVATWYGMPKTHYYFLEDFDLFTNEYQFGTIYLNYCEIGKTLEDLCRDKELDDHQYASSDAFKPFELFSADMHIKFYQRSAEHTINEKISTNECFDRHAEFFESRGYTKNDKRLNIGLLPVADLDTTLSNTEILELLSTHQYINNVSIIK